MAIIKSVAAQWAFLISEANDWRSRDEVTIDNTAGTEPIEPGTLLVAGATSADPMVPWTGAGKAVAILLQRVPVGEEVRRTVISRSAEVNAHELALPDGVTLEAARDALVDRDIIARINKGQVIDAVPSA